MSDSNFLDFYDTLTTVPVNQNGAVSNENFAQRTALYNMFGLPPVAIKNSAGNNIEVMQKSQVRFSSYLLDYRVDPSHAFSDETYQTLSLLCEQAMSIHDNYRVNERLQDLTEFIVVIEKVGMQIRDVMPETEQASLDFQQGLEQLSAGNLKADFASFH